MHLDEESKPIPHMFSELASSVLMDGNIAEIIEGPKRFSRVFIDDTGHLYQQNKKKKNGTLLLRCHTDDCSGTGIFNPETMSFHRLRAHFHNPDSQTVLKFRFLHSIKFRAENESTKLSKIYREEANKFHGAPLPPYDKIKSTLRKRRAASLIQNMGLSSSSLPNEKVDDRLGVATHYIARKGMEIIEGPKRFSKIYIDDHGYCYSVNRKKTDESLILRCHEDGCRGSGRYEPKESVFHKIAKHSHYADPLQVTKWRFLHKCKKRAENETTPIKVIYEEESQRYPNSNLPSFKKIESTLQKRRKSKRLTDLVEYVQTDADLIKSSEICVEEEEEEKRIEEVCNSEVAASNFVNSCISLENAGISKDIGNRPLALIIVQNSNYSQRIGTEVKYQPERETSSAEGKNTKKNKNSCQPRASVIGKERKRKAGKSGKKNATKPERLKAKYSRKPSEYSSRMDITEGVKRFSKIFIDEEQHIYQLKKAKLNGVLLLKCYERYCPGGGLYLPVEEIFRRNTEHTHESSPELVNKCRLLSNLKNRAEKETGSLRVIYEEEVAKFPGVQIPSYHQMESTLQKRRRAKIPSEPSSLEEAAFQFLRTDFAKNNRGDFRRLLKIDDECYKILVFISPGILEQNFIKSKIFHFDSSFRVVPQGFSQIVVLHFVFGNHIFPAVYALMNSCDTECYKNLLKYLKNEFENFDPQLVTADYDCNLEEAVRSIFPTAIVSGLWFHYTQVIWRHMRMCGLAQIFFQDEEAKLILKCSMALPLLPQNRIKDGLSFLVDKISSSYFHLKETKHSLLKITDYIRDEWLQRLGPKKFSVFGQERKINYDIEVLYRFFIKKLGIESPTLIKFVEKVCQIDSYILGEFEQKLSGKPVRADKSRKYSENEKLLRDLSYRFDLGVLTVENFLVSASAAVPRHCHHNDLAYDPAEETTVYDPSDIPVSLAFCEINVVSPCEENLETSKCDGLINNDIVVASNEFKEFTTLSESHSSAPRIYQGEYPVRKDFTYDVIWPSTLPKNTHMSKCNYPKNSQTPVNFHHKNEPVFHDMNVELDESVVVSADVINNENQLIIGKERCIQNLQSVHSNQESALLVSQRPVKDKTGLCFLYPSNNQRIE